MSVFLFSSCETNKVNKVTLSKSTMSLVLGEVNYLDVDVDYDGDITPNIEWTSSNSNVATVSDDGEIQALAEGTTVITAEAGDKTATCVITVSNEISENFTEGAVIYYADYYKKGVSNNYSLFLVGSTDTLYLEFNTALDVTDNIPTGTYTVTDSDDKTYQPSTVVAYNFENNIGSVFYSGQYFITAITEGIVVVTNNGNNNYKIEYDLTDYMGNILSGTYTGVLGYIDESGSASGISVAPQTIRRMDRSKIRKVVK